MFFYVRTTTYRARTGPVDAKLPYPCAHCGVVATALVRSEGNASSVAVYGGGGSAEMAKRKAFELAKANGLNALRTAACPSCGKLQPPVLVQFAAADRKLAWRRKVGVPLAAIAAGLFGVGMAALGLADHAHSMAPLFLALPLAITFGAIGIGAALRRWPSPLDKRTGSVWFWWTPPPTYREAAPAQWRAAAAPTAVPELRQPPRNAFVGGLLLAAFGVVLCFVSLGMLASMYDSVYVLNTSASTDLVVRVDGKAVGHVGPQDHELGKDAAYASFDVRSGQKHHLDLTLGGASYSYDLTPKDGHSWLLAPGSLQAQLCLLDEEVVYGSGEPADPVLLNKQGDLVELSHSYDDLLESPPTSMSTDASRVTRRALRAYDCASPDESSPRSFYAGVQARGH